MQLCVVIALGAAAGRLSSPCCVRSLNFIHFMMMRFVTAIININGKCRRTTIEPVHLVLSFQMCVSWCCFSAQQLLENVFASFFRLTFNLDPFLFMRRSLYCKLRNKLCSMNEWMGIKNFCWVGGWWTRDRIIKMKQKGPWNSIGLYRRAAAAFALALAFAMHKLRNLFLNILPCLEGRGAPYKARVIAVWELIRRGHVRGSIIICCNMSERVSAHDLCLAPWLAP